MEAGNVPNHSSSRAALLERSANLPWELTSLIIGHFVGTPVLSILSDESGALLRLHYEAETGPFNLPSIFKAEHEWHLRRKWLHATKKFHDATDFALLHIACLAQRGSCSIDFPLNTLTSPLAKFPDILRYSPELNLTGLESIELALPTDVFFAIFKVTVPPFPTEDNWYHRGEHYGTGKLLSTTRALTLNFGTSDASVNPWALLLQGHWAEVNENDARPNERGNLCSAGLLIDWILTYAWHHKFLQHIRKIALEGDIQDWVKVKWNKIFTRTHPEQDFVAGPERIAEIEHHGMSEAIASGTRWIPTEHFPPTCRCPIKCSRLREGTIMPEVPAAEEQQLQEWRIDPYKDSRPPELQNWFNNDGSDWGSATA